MQVSIANVTAQTKMFTLAGPESMGVLQGLGATAPASKQVILMGFQNSPVVVAAGSGLSGPGYTLIADELAAGELWRSLTVKASISLIILLVCYSLHAQLQCCMTDCAFDQSVLLVWVYAGCEYQLDVNMCISSLLDVAADKSIQIL